MERWYKSVTLAGKGWSHRKPLSDDLFALPALFRFTEELHVAMRKMWSVVCVEHEEARRWLSRCCLPYQGLLACLEQGIVLRRV